MSFSSRVPAAEPSLTHNSRPRSATCAENSRRSPKAPPRTRSTVGDDPPGPGTTSATRPVPSAVPSDLQSSDPAAASVIGKTSIPLKSNNGDGPGKNEGAPGLTSSRTTRVPSAVPSLTHRRLSFRCWRKNSRSPDAVRYTGAKRVDPGGGGGVFTTTVPWSVPSDFHNDGLDVTEPCEAKYSVEPTAVNSLGRWPAGRSFTRTVVAAVPCVFHRS